MKINILVLVYLEINFPAELVLKIDNLSYTNLPAPLSEANGNLCPLTVTCAYMSSLRFFLEFPDFATCLPPQAELYLGYVYIISRVSTSTVMMLLELFTSLA